VFKRDIAPKMVSKVQRPITLYVSSDDLALKASKHLQFGSGAVYVHIEKSQQDAQLGKIRFQLRGSNLHNKQTLGRKSSPYFEIFRRVEKPTGVRWTNVYKSNGKT